MPSTRVRRWRFGVASPTLQRNGTPADSIGFGRTRFHASDGAGTPCHSLDILAKTNPPPKTAHFGQTKPTSSGVLRRVSAHRGKVCGKIDVRLHRDEMIRAAGWRPNLVRDRLCAQPRPIFEAGIGPNVHESRHRAGDRMHGREQRRYCCAARRPLAPQLDGRRHAVRLEDIGAYLEYGAVLPGRHGRHEWERDVRVHAHGRDVLTAAERILAPKYFFPARMGARDVRSSAQQKDAVERADIRTPTGQEPIAGRERLLQARKRLLLRTGPRGDDRYVIVHSGFSSPEPSAIDSVSAPFYRG